MIDCDTDPIRIRGMLIKLPVTLRLAMQVKGREVYKYSYLAHNWVVLKKNNEHVKKNLPSVSGVVYDLGCGLRPFEVDIRCFADEYIGIDWSNTLHGLHADIVADLNKPLPIRDNVADTVVSFQVLEHLSEPQMVLNESHRILRRGGLLILAVPFQWHVHEAPWDFFRFTRYGLEHILAKAGFVEIRVEEVGGFWTTWFVKLNYQMARMVRGPRIMRRLVQVIFFPLWYPIQVLGPVLDRLCPDPSETPGYFVTAKRR